jgi:hypothetical protein
MPGDRAAPALDPERFPNNLNALTTGMVIEQDLRAAAEPLIITGFTSLPKLVDYLAPLLRNERMPALLQILVGHEPAAPQRDTLIRKHALPRAIADYWLEQRISLLQCSAIIAAIEVLERGRDQGTIEVKTSDDLVVHAKIYRGDGVITTGSSNFSSAGMKTQIESNVRFTEADDSERWAQLSSYAEWVWMQGRDYLDALIELLHTLLSEVSWQEALARACAEVLEGDWARRYVSATESGDAPALWPTQRQGIAQALWIMENLGSVLVADATGSGKTRMGAHLIKAAVERMWRTGQTRVDAPVLTCPRSIEASWQDEFRQCGGGVRPDVYTHGILSRPDTKNASQMSRALRQVQVFAIDEAHNFLDQSSQRTRTLYGNLADYVVLFTATPINKGARDLVAMIDILGADNFDDEILDLLDHTLRRGGKKAHLLSSDERDHLRHTIERFMVRRTTGMLNEAIDLDPEAYRDATGRPCRYPTQTAQTYRCPETESDRQIYGQITNELENLRGLVYLGTHLTPMQSIGGSRRPEVELETRLTMAASLARYHVISSLRSSRAALLEHISGTAEACRTYTLPGSIKGVDTGNQCGRLGVMAQTAPQSTYPVPLPPWLRSLEAYAGACRDEIAAYTRIATLVGQLSERREDAKVQQLLDLLARHEKVVAFDWHLITLHVIRESLAPQTDAEILIATGSDTAMRERTRALFDPDRVAPAGRAIALCSDAMSESIGLQRASAMVHLDLPSTIRKAEQRVGRLMRMNSPHPQIEVFWPWEPSLPLAADEHIVERNQTVDLYIRANLVLPAELKPELIGADMLTRQTQSDDDLSTDELGDAFAPVRALIEGPDALVPAATYKDLRTSKARVISSVSVVHATQPWAFFAIAGTEWGAPRWVYLDSELPTPVIELDAIATCLRRHLGHDTERHPLDDVAGVELTSFIHRLARAERSLLPKKKQRALEQMAVVLQRYAKRAAARGDDDRFQLCEVLRRRVEPHADAVDYRVLADCWLTLITPLWIRQLREGRKRRPVRIGDLTKALLEDEISTDALQAAFATAPLSAKPLDERIVSAIVGVAG